MNDLPFDYNVIATPCYVVDKGKTEHNLTILEGIQKKTGCKILLALKGFAMFSLFPLVGRCLEGVSASSLDEARLASEEFGKEVHVYSPAYHPDSFAEIMGYADHLIFNSFSQWELYKDQALHAKKKNSCGIRINPQHSEVDIDLYNPCSRYSRLGVTHDQFKPDQLDGIEGLHFHALCEQNSDALANTLQAVEHKFGPHLHRMKWINFGGGHHITRPDYDRDLLCNLINDFKERYGVEVYLEPGEAIALETGFSRAGA